MQESRNNTGQEGPERLSEIKHFTDNLTEEDRMLVVLQSQLYQGSWQGMLNDLRNRLDGKPYIFKLANRIREDIERIEKLLEFEKKNNVKLSDFVKPPGA